MKNTERKTEISVRRRDKNIGPEFLIGKRGRTFHPAGGFFPAIAPVFPLELISPEPVDQIQKPGGAEGLGEKGVDADSVSFFPVSAEVAGRGHDYRIFFYQEKSYNNVHH